ncbi:MAG: hypothetical protein JSS20_17800 [Proteobacteria bacterium]|nr:hypothetical protein [Pseudomonadota bacterium]
MHEALEIGTALLNLPIVKVVSLLASLFGMAVGVMSLRRVNQVASAQLANFRADHARYLNEQRSRIELWTLKDDGAAELVAETFGRADARAARREALLCLYLNTLASAHSAWRNGLMETAEYEKHMAYFFDDYKGDTVELLQVLANNYYPPGFDAECRKRLSIRRPVAPATTRAAAVSASA